MIVLVEEQPHYYKQFFSLFVLALILISYVIYAFVRPLPLLTATLTPIASPKPKITALALPSYGGAAVGAVGYNVLATSGVQTAQPTASIAKIMTALCVLRQKPLEVDQPGPNITMTADDVAIYNKYVAEDGSVVAVSQNETFTEQQLLQAMLLPSANNIAETLAIWAFGSIDAYNAYANHYASELQLSSLQITDPSGFLPTTVGSVADVTKLGELAIQNPVIAAIVSQSTADIGPGGVVKNVNALLSKDGTIGIKTGNNDQDPGAYLFAATSQVGDKPITVVGTIMQAADLKTALLDSLPLIKSTQANFSSVSAVTAGQVIGTYTTPWHQSARIIAQAPSTMVAWSGDKLSTKTVVTRLNPNSPGTTVGTITLTNARDNSSTTTNLTLQTPLQKPNLFWRLSHPF